MMYSFEVDSLFCHGRTYITVRQSKSFEDREIGKQFAWTQTEQDSALAKCRLGLRGLARQETNALPSRCYR